MVREILRPSSIAAMNGREVVIDGTHVGHFTRDIAAALADRDADIGSASAQGHR